MVYWIDTVVHMKRNNMKCKDCTFWSNYKKQYEIQGRYIFNVNWGKCIVKDIEDKLNGIYKDMYSGLFYKNNNCYMQYQKNH